MNKRKTTLLTVIAVMLVIVMLTAYIKLRPQSSDGDKSFTVKVVHLDGETRDFTYTSDEEYLGPCLQEEGLLDGTQAEYGLLVETVDNETADESKEQWWGYTVNGEFSNYGVDTQPVNDGDVYEFTLNEGYDNFN